MPDCSLKHLIAGEKKYILSEKIYIGQYLSFRNRDGDACKCEKVKKQTFQESSRCSWEWYRVHCTRYSYTVPGTGYTVPGTEYTVPGTGYGLNRSGQTFQSSSTQDTPRSDTAFHFVARYFPSTISSIAFIHTEYRLNLLIGVENPRTLI